PRRPTPRTGSLLPEPAFSSPPLSSRSLPPAQSSTPPTRAFPRRHRPLTGATKADQSVRFSVSVVPVPSSRIDTPFRCNVLLTTTACELLPLTRMPTGFPETRLLSATLLLPELSKILAALEGISVPLR